MNGAAGTLVMPTIDGPAAAQTQSTPVLCRRSYGRPVFRQEFDAAYIERLKSGDQATAEHFTFYFESLLQVKLRRRGWSGHDIEDMCQETFLRVIRKLRSEGIEHPECIGGFVNSVCNNVMRELCRAHTKHPSVDASENEPIDGAIDMEGLLINDERKKFVLLLLAEMPGIESRVLRMIYLEETEREEICQRLNIGRDYLRVVLHRALTRFKALADKPRAASAS